MKVLTRDSLPLGGFAGLTEHRLVTDSRVFAGRKSPYTLEGLGQFVYLADARFNPHGDTTMHPHKEIDVITIMLEGEVTHEGSLEHGKSLKAGEVQVQRAGGEGFAHNEINPHDTRNRLLQVWALPEEAGQPASYKHYQPQIHGVTRIYGGDKSQQETFDSSTYIDIVRLEKGDKFATKSQTMAYVTKGHVSFVENGETVNGLDGTLARGNQLTIDAQEDSEIVVITV